LLQKPKSILIADDCAVGRRVMQKLIESIGYPSSCFCTASNGVEVIECLKKHLADVIFMVRSWIRLFFSYALLMVSM
jgi:CheY-like chemotaxis protein